MTDTGFRPAREPLVFPGGVELFERDMTVTVAGDVTLAEVQRRLASAGQWLPIDGDPSQAVGRLVEINSTGLLRLGYGAWRDLLLGCQFRNGTGELISAGGRTVKNVAGYDLTKFAVGQQRRVGKIVTITSRTYLRPAGAVVARNVGEVNVTELLASALRPQWIMEVPEGTVLGYLGDEAYLEFCQERAEAKWPGAVRRRSLKEDVAERAERFSKTYDSGFTFRASMPPANLRPCSVAVPGKRWAGDLAFGIARGNVDEKDVEEVHRFAKISGAKIWGEENEPLPSGAEGELLERIVAAFGGEQGQR